MIEAIGPAELDALRAAAEASPRGRAHRELHADGREALAQRFLVGFLKGSYFRPHCHLEAHKTELTAAVHGRCEVLSFDDDGTLLHRQLLGGEGAVLLQIPPKTWHAIAALDDFAVILEIKQGPYDAASDKRFADWAPAEGSQQVADCERWLRSAAAGTRFG